MSLGAILFSAAVLIVSAAFVARPFRRERLDVDRVIDVWVRRARAAGSGAEASPEYQVEGYEEEPFRGGPDVAPQAVPVERRAVDAAHVASTDAGEDTNFCPYCGRQVEPDHLFCPKCGRQLVKGDRQ